MAILPQGYQELSVVTDKVGRPPATWAWGKQVYELWYFSL